MPAVLRHRLLSGASQTVLTLLTAAPLGISLMAGQPTMAVAADYTVETNLIQGLIPEDKGVADGETVFVRADLTNISGDSAIESNLTVVTIDNEAVISAGPTEADTAGILLGQDGIVSNAAGAKIIGYTGIRVAGDLELDNAGEIQGVGVFENGVGISVGGTAQIRNSGTITADSVGVIVVDGTVTNLAGGLITGKTIAITSLGAVPIVNEGNIVGGGTGIDLSALPAGQRNEITNRGIIRGDLIAIEFEASDDLLTLDTGSQIQGAKIAEGQYDVGFVEGAGGIDTLVLKGTGEDDATFANFENLNAEAGAFWRLSGESLFSSKVNLKGILAIDGEVTAGSVEVQQGGGLGGQGTLNATEVTFKSGSLLTQTAGVNIPPLFIEAGKVEVEQGASVLIFAVGDFEQDEEFTLLTAAEGITGAFDDFTQATLRLSFDVQTNPNNVVAVANIRTFEEAGATENQKAVGAALDSAEGNGGAEFDELVAAVDLAGAVLDAAALDQVSGDFHASTASTGLVTARGFLEGLAGRVGAGSSGGQVAGLGQVASLTQVAAGPLPSGPGAGIGAWAALDGTFGTLEDENAGDTDYDSFGGTVGGDFAVMPNLVLGAALGFAVGSSETADRGATADSTVVRLAGYGRWFSGPISVTGALGASFGSLESERATPLGLATGETDATAFGFAAEGRYALALSGFTVSPLAGLSFTSLTQEAFEETGAGAANLAVGEATADSFRASLGAVASKTFATGGAKLTPEARLVYRHEFADGFGEVSNAFLADATATSFTVIGAEPAADVVEIGAGVTAELANGMSLFGDLGFTLGDGQTETNLQAGLRMSF